MLTIEITEHVVNILSSEKDGPRYNIRKDELPLTIIIHGNKVSEWVHQLYNKTWMNADTLYNLARVIQDEFPDNEIDWNSTFFIVEKSSYLKHVDSVDQLGENDFNPKSEIQKIFKSIDSSAKESNSEIHDKVNEIVRRRLESYGLN